MAWVCLSEHDVGCMICFERGEIHYRLALPGQPGAFVAAIIPCSVPEPGELTGTPLAPISEKASGAPRCEVAASFFGIDLGPCGEPATHMITFTCERQCVRAPQLVCGLHHEAATTPAPDPNELSVCRVCEEAGRGDVLIRLLSSGSLVLTSEEGSAP